MSCKLYNINHDFTLEFYIGNKLGGNQNFNRNQRLALGIRIHIWHLKDRWADRMKKYFFSGAFCSDINGINTWRVL